MALITCEECGEKVSNKSLQCIHCGVPINAGAHSITIQKTSKTLKVHLILSIMCILIGLFLFLIGNKNSMEIEGGILSTVGFIWLFMTKIKIWWNHK